MWHWIPGVDQRRRADVGLVAWAHNKGRLQFQHGINRVSQQAHGMHARTHTALRPSLVSSLICARTPAHRTEATHAAV